MRSIRRSLLGYLLLLLALALGAVAVLVDQFANGAIRQREESEEKRIAKTFELRQFEAKSKFDADLLAETRAKAGVVQLATRTILRQHRGEPPRPGRPERPDRVVVGGGPGPPPAPQPPVLASEEEAREFRLRTGLLQLTVAPGIALAAAADSLQPQFGLPPQARRWMYPGWSEFDAPRLVARIGEALHKEFDDDHTGYFQFTLVGTSPNRSDRTLVVVRSTALGNELALGAHWLAPEQLAPVWLAQNQDLGPKVDDIEVPGKGKCRQVVTGIGGNGFPLFFVIPLPYPPPLAPSVPNRQPPYRQDVYVHVLVHHVRPYSELNVRLTADQKERDEQIEHIREETRMELAQLRARLILIGSCTFAALVLGGWFIVAAGLSPLRKLSDAVSRVSEKDFRLPVVPAELGHELAPIHARLTQTLTLLQRAFAREKQAVADISHELRTPIASLLATIDVALRKPRTPDQYRATLEECRLISKQLGQLVERIMTLASLDAGNDHAQVGRVEAAELVGGCAAVIRPLAAAHNLTVSVHPADDLVLETDAAKLREVLMNLLHNAVEYNKPGGTIELTVRRDGSSAVFAVRDTGIGMTAEVKDKIFERFYRADAARHATGVHAGLGLAIVKEYVARLNGTIVVESEPGVGTTFRITLPAVLPSASPPAPPPSGDRAKARDTVPAGS